MGLPKQVRQQIAEAKRIEGAIRAEQQAADTPPSPAADPQPSPAPVLAPDPAAAPAAEPQAAPVAEPAPVPVPPANPVKAPDGTEHYAELLQQYRSLQGIHRTLTRTNSDLQSQVQSLHAQVVQLSGEIAQVKKASQPAAAPVAPLTSDEIKEFGPDLISVIERKAQEVAAPLNTALSESRVLITQLQERNAQLEQSLTGVSSRQAQDAHARFSTELQRLVPDFNTLNYDRNFLSWLAQPDPLDAQRRTLQQRLQEAVDSLDAEAVSGYFDAYRRLVVAAQPAPQPRPDLAAQAQPASRSAPDTSRQPAGKQWTQNDISIFYADVARGRYAPQEKARIEREIFNAQRDNRIAA